MICDIIVRAAQFDVTVVATRELLFQNEIYGAGQQQTLHEQANFVLLDCDVHSFKDAAEWVTMNTMRLQAKVGDTMRSTLNDMGWQITWVNARNENQWQIVLQDQNGPARQDKGLIQVPKS